MQAFKRETGIVAPLDRVDVDTDQIIPKQFLKRIERTGFGQFLFYDWMRDPGFELRQPGYQGASILVSGRNFGCGSSREHAPWALQDFGFKVVIAPSFGDIFFNNSFKNGMLPIELPEETVNELLARAKERPGYRLTVDLEKQEIGDEEGTVARFDVDPFRKHLLLNGLDDIGLTLAHEPEITRYEKERQPARLRGLTTAGAS